MRSLSRLQAVLLGVTACAGLALAGTGLFAVGSRQWLWNEGFEVRVGFRQIRGVDVGTRVRIQGIDAGEVVAVEPPETPGNDVRLRLRLDSRFRHLVRADACAKILNEGMVGGKVVEIDPGSPTSHPVADDALIASLPTVELTDAAEQLSHEAVKTLQEVRAGVRQVSQTVQEVQNGEGALGQEMRQSLREVSKTLREVRDGEGTVGKELVQSLQQFRGTLSSIKRDVDAVQQLPFVGGYVKDPLKRLIRPDCDRQRTWFREGDLFEPGQAVLSGAGQQRLDQLVPWLNDTKPKGSEVIVAAYADRTWDADRARIVTQKQSEAVCDYLKAHHGIHKSGWFSRRDVVPLGCGTDPPPVPETENLPYPRIEVVLFVPQK
jgi:phospholipid/cholesterol/gamma-HCH transport system substrate-binding protein